MINGLYANYLKRRNEFIESGNFLAHFTRAQIALDILTKREIWLGNVAYMNDYNEMTTGMKLVSEVVNVYPWKQSFRGALNSINHGLSEEVITTLNAIQQRYYHTYGFYMCEFNKDNLFGEQYMWKNYASESGVAIVFNNSIIDKETNPLTVELLPMYYYGREEVIREVEDFTAFINDNILDIKQISYELVKNAILDKLSYAVWSLKDPKYRLEKEWRLMLNDKIMLLGLGSKGCLRKEIVTIGSEPRYVYKFNYERAGFKLNDILERIIIGTCDHPNKVRDLFIEDLKGIVDNIEDKVVIAAF